MIDRSVMQKSIAYPAGRTLALAGALVAAVGIKVLILSLQAVPFNADEAIVALMGRHILHGELPIFFYGQAYMGSLDAFLVAGLFKIFGEQVWVIRGLQIALYAGTLLTTYLLGKEISGRWQIGVLATWLLALPTISMTLYTTVSMGGYGEMLLIGNLILLLTVRISTGDPDASRRVWYLKWFGLGFLSGFGVWVFGLTLVYSIPALAFLVWMGFSRKPVKVGKHSQGKNKVRELARQWIFLLAGLLLGVLPLIIFGVQGGFSDLVNELGGSAIAGVESLSYPAQVLRHLLNLVLFGSSVLMGLRPPWEVRWLALPLAPLVLSFWVAVLIWAVKKGFSEIKRDRQPGEVPLTLLLWGVVGALCLGFILTPFGADPSGRYFLPIVVIMALCAALAIWDWRRNWGNYALLGVGLLLIFHLWGTIQSIARTPPGVTTQFDSVTQIDHRYDQALIQFLQAEGERFGYTNYWVAYPLAFLSAEELVFIPSLPYHPDLRYTSRDNRYEPYTQQVEESLQAAYITTRNPRLDQQIRSGFKQLGVEWKEKEIGDYQVYYQISAKVTPQQIGLGGGEG